MLRENAAFLVRLLQAPQGHDVGAVTPVHLELLGGVHHLLEGGVDDEPLDTFPVAFREGMGTPERSRILNDTGPDAPDKWQWGSAAKPVDVVIVCYAETPASLKAEIAAMKRQTTAAGMSVTAELPLKVRREGKRAVEHFGFVDGVSQPIVRGTARAAKGDGGVLLT